MDTIARGERFDAILCDLMMPGMTGMDLHEALSRLAPEQASRVVVLTGGAFTLERASSSTASRCPVARSPSTRTACARWSGRSWAEPVG